MLDFLQYLADFVRFLAIFAAGVLIFTAINQCADLNNVCSVFSDQQDLCGKG